MDNWVSMVGLSIVIIVFTYIYMVRLFFEATRTIKF